MLSTQSRLEIIGCEMNIENCLQLRNYQLRIIGKCANSSRLKNVSVIVLACAKLHNLCVDRWITDGSRFSMNIGGGTEQIPMHDGVEDSRPTDIEVVHRLKNRYATIGSRAVVCDLRNVMSEKIWESGLRITSENDLVGLSSILQIK